MLEALAVYTPPPTINPLMLWAGGVILVLGLLVYGLKDLLRFSPRRVWAIGSVVFRESIRRRVLWITPLAILGMIIVSQLQHPIDEQDAIRQTIKFCLFATGLVVVITAIIMAATNLPKEIDSRVIYTVVTKPTTRLEIVLGKVLGFGRVSATILLIMGLATWVYLGVRSWSMQAEIRDRLEVGIVDPATRATLEYYAEHGLLNARSVANPQSLQVLARLPENPQEPRSVFGAGDATIEATFSVDPVALTPAGIPGAFPGSTGLVVVLNLGFTASDWRAEESWLDEADAPLPDTVAAPMAPAATPLRDARMPTVAELSLQILDENNFLVIRPELINGGRPVRLTHPEISSVQVHLAPEAAAQLVGRRIFKIQAITVTGGVEYLVPETPIVLIVPGATPELSHLLLPVEPPRLLSRFGRFGLQLRGGEPNVSPIALFEFRNVRNINPVNGRVHFELRTGIERSGVADDDEAPTVLQVQVQSPGQPLTQPITVYPESRRPAYFTVPAEVVVGGDFDLIIRNLTQGHFVGVDPATLSIMRARQPFVLNLLASLLILWMLSLLVVSVAVFCSTFLSWPIAVVLTLVILLGRWGVVQLGDATAPGIGAQVATDMGIRDARAGRVVSEGVERLAQALNALAAILPDISRFQSIESLERGVVVPSRTLGESLAVLAMFGIPTIVLAYVILRNKEVAP